MTPGYVLAAAGMETTESAAAVIDFQSALMLVMVVCLAFMAKALADLNRRVCDLTETRPGMPATAGSSAGRPTTATPPADVALMPATLAAITAAVYATFEHPVQIIAVDEVTAEQARHWSLEGRRQIFTSHRVR